MGTNATILLMERPRCNCHVPGNRNCIRAGRRASRLAKPEPDEAIFFHQASMCSAPCLSVSGLHSHCSGCGCGCGCAHTLHLRLHEEHEERRDRQACWIGAPKGCPPLDNKCRLFRPANQGNCQRQDAFNKYCRYHGNGNFLRQEGQGNTDGLDGTFDDTKASQDHRKQNNAGKEAPLSKRASGLRIATRSPRTRYPGVLSLSMLPSTSLIVRSHCSDMRGSCVTSSTAQPNS